MFTHEELPGRNDVAMRHRIQSRITGLFAVFIPLCVLGVVLSPCQDKNTPAEPSPIVQATPALVVPATPSVPVAQTELPQLVVEEEKPTL